MKFLLDEPISNSGRLRERILEHAKMWKPPTEVELVRDPDAVLRDSANVATSDSVILDHCASWLNLARSVLAEILHLWIIKLQ